MFSPGHDIMNQTTPFLLIVDRNLVISFRIELREAPTKMTVEAAH